MEKKETRVLIIDDGSKQVKEAIATLNAIETTRISEGKALPISLETREREKSRKIQVSPFIPMMIGMMGVAAGYQGGWPQGRGPFYPEPPKPIKRCLQCGKEHKHNNAFCSADCCKAYKLKK